MKIWHLLALALLLSPVPEPAAVLMLLAGLALAYSRPAMRRTISSP